MQEYEPLISEEPRHDYGVLSERAQALFEAQGGQLKEGFPTFGPKWQTSSYEYPSKTLTLHPWISVKDRVGALLDSTVRILTRKQGKRDNAEHSRDAVIIDDLYRHFGLHTDPHRLESSVANIFEQAIVDHIVRAVTQQDHERT